MILALMVYSIVAGAALAGVGWLVELMAARRGGRRLAWAVVLGGLLVLTIVAPWRAALDTAVATTWARVAALGSMSGTTLVKLGSPVAFLQAGAGAARDAFGRFDVLIAWLWIVASLGVVTAHLVGRRALVLRRRSWRSAVVDGEPVWISAADGPALVRVFSPVIVLPAWAIELSPEAQRLTLHHEREHRRAHDPLLIQLASLGPLLLPWNPAAWWMVSRLKLAAEIDCDGRVLGRARDDLDAYGELLLAVASKHSTISGWLRPAMLERPSLLRRRLSAMYADRGNRSPVRETAIGAAAFLCSVLVIAMPAPIVQARVSQSTENTRDFGQGAIDSRESGVTRPKVIFQTDPQYTKAAMDRKITGEVMLEFVVKADGTVGETRIVKSLDKKYGLDDAAKAAVSKWKFQPGKRNGQPVAVICSAVCEFRLR